MDLPKSFSVKQEKSTVRGIRKPSSLRHVAEMK
jgi:hypothetical protein